MPPAIDLLRAAVATPLERLSSGVCTDPRIRFAGGILDAAGGPHLASQLTRRGNRLQIPTPAGSDLAKRTGRWLYGGIWFDHFGHFLLETLARAWHLADNPGPVVFHRPPDRSGAPVATTMSLWQEELVTALLGTPSRIHFLTLPTEFEELVVPEPGCVIDERCTAAQADALATIGKRLAGAPPTAANDRKLWLSRSALTRGRVVGEREFETELAAAGFEVIHLEKMPLAAQVRAFDEARLVAGFTGSAFHTTLLASRRRAELIHFARFTAHNKTFALCAAAAGYPSRFHDCFIDFVADSSPQRSGFAAARDVRQDFAAVRRTLQSLGVC